MREVRSCLYFLQPCLSGIKNGKAGDDPKLPHFIFLRDSTGKNALILQEHWTRTMVFARKAMSVAVKPFYDVRFDPIVIGEIGIHHRFYSPKNPNLYKRHESFLEGTRVEVRAMLPTGLSLADFRRTLEMAGRYAGITIHGWGEHGRFEVIDAT